MDDENSWSIHDLDNAPEPPMHPGSASASGGLMMSPRVSLMRTTTATGTITPSSGGMMKGGGDSSNNTNNNNRTARRRHSVSNLSPAAATPSTLSRPKSIALRDRTWSAPGYPQHNHYSVPNFPPPSQFLVSSPPPQPPTQPTIPSSAESPLRSRANSNNNTIGGRLADIPSSTSLLFHSSSSSLPPYLPPRSTTAPHDPPSLHRHRYGGRRSTNGASSPEKSNLHLPELLSGGNSLSPSRIRSKSLDDYYGYKEGHTNNNNIQETNVRPWKDDDEDDDDDSLIRLEPGGYPHEYLGDVAVGMEQAALAAPLRSALKQSSSWGMDSDFSNTNIEANPPKTSPPSLVGGMAAKLSRTHSLSSNTSGSMPSVGHAGGGPPNPPPWDDPLEDSSHNHSAGNGNDDDDDDDDDDLSQTGSMTQQHLQSKPGRWKRPTLHQISTCVVMHVYAPFFWIWYGWAYFFPYCCKPPPATRSMRQPTDRAILARLNVLVGCFGLLQIASALFYCIVTIAANLTDRVVETRTETERQAQESRLRSSTNIWNVALNLYLLGVEAFVLVVAAVLTVRVVRNVNLVGAIRYLWVLLWILPFEIYFNIGLYDYFRVTDVWVRQYWRDPSLGWFREKFCEPSETANTLCAVPLGINETEWCLDEYNSTSCASIRNSAQKNTEKWLLSFYYLNASLGLVLICLLFLVVNTLEGIISKPLVRKSRQSNIPAWLSLPIVSCFLFGIVFTFAQTSVLNTRSDTDANWIGPLYMATAGLFFMAALLGWYISVSSITNTRHKRNKMISISTFIILMVVIGGLLISLFAASITFSSSFVEIPLTDSQRGDLACIIDQAGSCTNCDLPHGDPNRCPEWSVSDVTKVIQTQAKSSAALAAILMLYSFGALRFGFGMRKHIRMYQIQYI